MEQVHMIGIDLAKNSFQLHGARADGSVAFRKKLSRAKLLGFVAAQPRCTVAMEACGGAHHWGRETGSLGHAVRLVPPIYVKAYVKRQKNDASDAEAICEASSRPTMRFVAVKTEEQQARGMLFRTRDLLVRQRTQTINALRGHLAEFGVIAPQGPAHVGRLASALEGPADGFEILQGHVEMDEAYVGGKRSGGKRGRGAPGKTIVFGMKERGRSHRNRDRSERPEKDTARGNAAQRRAGFDRFDRRTHVLRFTERGWLQAWTGAARREGIYAV